MILKSTNLTYNVNDLAHPCFNFREATASKCIPLFQVEWNEAPDEALGENATSAPLLQNSHVSHCQRKVDHTPSTNPPNKIEALKFDPLPVNLKLQGANNKEKLELWNLREQKVERNGKEEEGWKDGVPRAREEYFMEFMKYV